MKEENIKILIIEDEKALADILLAKIKKEGFNVEVAYDGEEGFGKIGEFKPDLILLDIVMPKMNGYEVLEKMNEEGIKVPVIIISNSGQPVEIEKTKKLGAVDCLIKAEFSAAEVIDKIRSYLHNQENEGDLPTIAPAMAKEIESNGLSVLLVEDESFLREICGRKLANEGYKVYTAFDGEQALKALEKIEPDIILLDIILPAIDGFEVLSSIRAHKNQAIKETPVIMLSNLGQDDDIKKAMDLGADNYLVKANFSTEEISEKVKEVLAKRKA